MSDAIHLSITKEEHSHQNSRLSCFLVFHHVYEYSVFSLPLHDSFLNDWSILVKPPILVFSFYLVFTLFPHIIGCANNINLSSLAFNLLVFVGLLDSRNRRARGHVSSPNQLTRYKPTVLVLSLLISLRKRREIFNWRSPRSTTEKWN